jgi:hypothetical protein
MKSSQQRKPQNLRDLQEEYKEKVVGLCTVCSKPVSGFYGRWGDGGTCSLKCEKVQSAKPLYPEHPAEAFEKLHGL